MQWQSTRFMVVMQLLQVSESPLEKPTGSQAVKKFPASYGIRIFVTSFTSVCQLNPVHAPLPSFWKCILLISSNLCPGLPSGFFNSGFQTKLSMCLYPYMLYPHPIFVLDLMNKKLFFLIIPNSVNLKYDYTDRFINLTGLYLYWKDFFLQYSNSDKCVKVNK